MKTNIPESLIAQLRQKDKTFVVALEDELPPGTALGETLYTGTGSLRMLSALYQWYDRQRYAIDPDEHALILLGSACSARHPLGTVLQVGSIVSEGSERTEERIQLEGATDGAASLLTCNWLPTAAVVNPSETPRLLATYDLFDTEAYAAARFCRDTGLHLVCFKGVVDELQEGVAPDWRRGLKEVRRSFGRLVNMME